MGGDGGVELMGGRTSFEFLILLRAVFSCCKVRSKLPPRYYGPVDPHGQGGKQGDGDLLGLVEQVVHEPGHETGASL